MAKHSLVLRLQPRVSRGDDDDDYDDYDDDKDDDYDDWGQCRTCG